MDTIKRVLDRINPYEARYTDFYDNESPATYSSMLQIAGKPFNGKVALNSDKSAVENAGMKPLREGQRIQYEVVSERGKTAAGSLTSV